MHTDFTCMTMEQIVDETRDWPQDDVAELVDGVKYGDIPPPIDAAWHEEIHRRIADLESGRLQAIPLEETLAKARAIANA